MTASRRTLLELCGVNKLYGATRVLRDVDLAIEDGEFLTILGPSGSGKTTILRLIGGFIAPSSGDIRFDGTSVVPVPIFKRPFNTVFQDYALFPHMRVNENVAYGLRVRGVGREEIRSRVARALAVVALGEFGERYPAQLSGGQRQRVALARALILEPRILLLDEPLGALDAELRRQMQQFLMRLQREVRTTFVFVTHDQEEAITMSDRICVMREGVIEQVGPPTELYYRPRTPFVAGFFGDNNLLEGTLGGADGAARTVRTPFGDLRSATAGQPEAAAAADGRAVKVAVRPENLRLAPAEGTCDNWLAVRIAEVRFVGPISHILAHSIDRPDIALLLKRPSQAGGLGVAAGDRTAIGWNAAECSIVLQ
ncbi:MAG: ABC transporter ATP-binding protein [Alphaproteobacteria bacterium]|nr:ABC transporter ATP-binding protein [Alphaproteobacteria bacterium]